MALTRDFKQTIAERVEGDPAFAKALLDEAASLLPRPTGRHWNYRAIRFEHGEDSHIAVHEVHYQDGMPVAYAETPAVVLWSCEEPAGTGLAILGRMRVLAPTEI